MGVKELSRKVKRAIASAITTALVASNIAGLFGFTTNASNNGAANFLRDCAKYGIVANEINQTSHMQTNFATGKYIANDQYNGADMSNNAGDIMIGELVGSVKLNGGAGSTVVYVDPSVKGTVAGMIQRVKEYADSVVGYNSVTLDPVTDMNNYAIDVTGLAESTVYINLDQINFGGIANGGVKLSMRDDQTVVFNTKAATFTIPRYSVNVVGSLSNAEIAENIIWNMPQTTSLTIASDNARATVIAPLADTYIATTAEGNLVCNKVTGNGGEWHFISRRVPVPTPTPTPIPPQYGELTLSKEVVGLEEGAEWSFDFTVEVAIPADTEFETGSNAADLFANGNEIVVTLSNAEPDMTIVGLPEGTTYAVTEAEVEGYTTEATGATGEITADGVKVEFVNTWTPTPTPTPEPVFGDLTVTKSVEGLEDDETWAFDFTVEISVPDGAAFAEESDAASLFADGNSTTFTLTNEAASKTIAGLPEGTTYTVTEAEVEGYTTEVTGATGEITANGAQVSFVNTWTVTPTPTEEPTPTPTEEPTPTPTEEPTPTPTEEPTPTPTEEPTPTPTEAPTPTPTEAPTPTPTEAPTPTPTNTPMPTPTNTPMPTPTNTPTPTPTEAPTPTPTNTPMPTPTEAPAPTPTNTPMPTPTPVVNTPTPTTPPAEPTPTPVVNTPTPTTPPAEPTPTPVVNTPTPTTPPAEPTPTPVVNTPTPTTPPAEPTPTPVVNTPTPTTPPAEPTPTPVVNTPTPAPTTPPVEPTPVVVIPDEDVPLADIPGGDVLGANRVPTDEGEVLGARRAAQTDDNSRAALWTAILLGSVAGVGAWSVQKKKNQDEGVEE